MTQAVQALKQGAVDILPLPYDERNLLAVVQQALTRSQQQVATHFLRQHFQQLSLRDRQLLELLSQGQINKAMAAHFQVTVKTIEYHRRRLMQKLGVRCLAELLAQYAQYQQSVRNNP